MTQAFLEIDMFRVESPAPTNWLGPTPWESLGSRVGCWRQELISRQRADGSWLDPETAASMALAEWLIAAAYVPGCLPSEITTRIRQLLNFRHRKGGWGTPETTVIAYLALVLHQVSDDVLRPTREWLVGHGPISLSSRAGLLLRGTGQMPRWVVGDIREFASTDEQLSAAVLASVVPAEANPRDAILNHVVRDWRRVDSTPRWFGSGGPRLRQARRELMDWLRSDHRKPIGSALPVLALHAISDDADGSLRRRLLNELTTAEREPGALTNSLSDQLAVDDTIDSFLSLIEAGLPQDHPALMAADAWLWQRLSQTVASANAPADRLARLLMAVAARPTPLADDRALLLEPALEELLARQTPDGTWSPAECTGLVLECLGRYGMILGQPAIDRAVDYLARAQTAEGHWRSAQPTLAAAWIVQGVLAVGGSPTWPMVQHACAFLRKTLEQSPQDYVSRDELDCVAISAVEALLDAHQADGQLLGAIVPGWREARPRTVREIASLLRVSAKICRCTSPRHGF